MNSTEKQLNLHFQVAKMIPSDAQMSFLDFSGQMRHLTVQKVGFENPPMKAPYYYADGLHIADGTPTRVNLEDIKSVTHYLGAKGNFIVMTYEEINTLFGVAGVSAYNEQDENKRNIANARMNELKKMFRDYSMDREAAIEKIVKNS